MTTKPPLCKAAIESAAFVCKLQRTAGCTLKAKDILAWAPKPHGACEKGTLGHRVAPWCVRRIYKVGEETQALQGQLAASRSWQEGVPARSPNPSAGTVVDKAHIERWGYNPRWNHVSTCFPGQKVGLAPPLASA